MLTGEEKKAYQREYMRRKRSNKPALDPVRPVLDPVTDVASQMADVLDKRKDIVASVRKSFTRQLCPYCREEGYMDVADYINAQIKPTTPRIRPGLTHASTAKNVMGELPLSKARQAKGRLSEMGVDI